MKPTDEQIEQYFHDHSDCFADAEGNLYPIAAMTIKEVVNSAQWAISQMQPEWVACHPMSIEVAAKLANTDLNLIVCLFENGEVKRFNEDHPFELLTHLCFLPQPPTK